MLITVRSQLLKSCYNFPTFGVFLFVKDGLAGISGKFRLEAVSQILLSFPLRYIS